MKKHLLLLVVSIAMIQLVSAQVIEVIGNGVLYQESPTLTITDLPSVDKVVVEAAAIFEHGAVVPTVFPDVITFSSAVDHTVPFMTVEELKAPWVTQITVGPDTYFTIGGNYYSDGYYTATFNKADISADGVISLDKNGQGENIMTFFAYVYRTDGNVIKYSIISAPENRALLFVNGAGDPLVREFTLPLGTGPRNIEVAVPLSDRNDIDNRVGIITLFSGAQQTDAKVFQLNNGFVNFHVEKVMLYDVPMNVTDVRIEIYSPQEPVEGKNGDSFIVSLPVLTVEEESGCTRTLGYWKTHSTYGPAKADATWELIGPDATFFLSGKTYLEVLGTSPKGNPYYILAHQYIAAELNFLAGAYDGAVDDEFAEAKILLQAYTPAQVAAMANNNAVKKAFTTLGGILDKYNNGIIGPGHCGDVEEKSARISDESGIAPISEFAVYPNPVSNNAVISFNAANDGLATVELYNSVGQKVGRILQQNVLKGVQVKAAFNGLELHEGLYILVLQNGNYRETAKIRISR